MEIFDNFGELFEKHDADLIEPVDSDSEAVFFNKDYYKANKEVKKIKTKTKKIKSKSI
jgi:hypothetical protein